ncbi:hypothetical protein HZH66_007093 [Vespula vulgaris]|uniref:Uncharacterized protein n=1 Tax=Vespula vulgaris TaxID=7454 RepID=A0A834JXJ5_VESVU|nr:hypothetical protein HZH66_007093 [Vespula vulgaris]
MTCHFLPFLGKELVSKQVLASKVNRKYEQMHENSVNCGLGRGGEGGEIVILVLVIVIVVVGLTRKSRRASRSYGDELTSLFNDGKLGQSGATR